MEATKDDFKELVEIIKTQLQAAELMLDVLENNGVSKYVASIEQQYHVLRSLHKA